MKHLELSVHSDQKSSTQRCTRVRVHGAGGGEMYWDFEGEVLPHEPRDADFAAVAMLPFAMHYGRDLRVRGALTRSLVEALEECIDVWTMWRPDVYPHRIGIEADRLLDDDRASGASAEDAVLTFSGGVDATFALVAHQTGLLGRRSRRIRAGVMIHGFDLALDRTDWFESAAAHARAILEEQGAAFTTVRSNWREFCVDWSMGHMFGLFAVLHQFHGCAGCGVLAADMDYSEVAEVWGNNSLTNRMLSGASFPIYECGGGYTRTQKVATIARFPQVQSHLRVCWERPELGRNCGVCEKCVRTQLNLMAAGYSSVPAFPGPLAPETVAALSFRNRGQQYFLQSVLRYDGGRHIPEEIRAAIAQAAGKPLRRPGLLRALRERLRVRQRIRVALAR